MLYGVQFPVTIDISALPNTAARARRKLEKDLAALEAQGHMPYGSAQSGLFLDVTMSAFPMRFEMADIKKKIAHGFSGAATITVDHVGGEGGSTLVARRSVEFVRKNTLAQAMRAVR